jgi:hypothetical protein
LPKGLWVLKIPFQLADIQYFAFFDLHQKPIAKRGTFGNVLKASIMHPPSGAVEQHHSEA